MWFCLLFYDFQKLLEHEKQKSKQTETAIKQLLNESKALLDQLRECNLKFLVVHGDEFDMYSSSLAVALDMLTMSDNQIGVLLRKVPFVIIILIHFLVSSIDHFPDFYQKMEA